MTFIEWLRLLVENHQTIQYVIVFAGAAFGGEVALISLSFLLAQGLFSFWPFVVVCFFATFSSDILWFWLGRTTFVDKLFSHRYTKNTVQMILEAVDKISHGSSFIALLLANFMLASRVVLIMYVSKSRLSVKKFLFQEAIAVMLWLAVVVCIGYVSGLGFTYLSNILDNIYFGLGFVLAVLMIITFAQIWFKKKLEREGEEILAQKGK